MSVTIRSYLEQRKAEIECALRDETATQYAVAALRKKLADTMELLSLQELPALLVSHSPEETSRLADSFLATVAPQVDMFLEGVIDSESYLKWVLSLDIVHWAYANGYTAALVRHEHCGTFSNGPGKAYAVCNGCGRVDYEANEGDRCREGHTKSMAAMPTPDDRTMTEEDSPFRGE